MNKKNPQSPSRRGHGRPKRKGKKSPKKGGWGFFKLFRSFPSWLLWVGGILITAAYVCFFYYTFVSPFSFRWRAIYGEPTYPEGYEVRGIDISHYQERINWEKLRNASIGDAPVSFVFIKATEGEKLFDDNFNRNFANAKRNDLIRGAYHFFVPGIDPRKQAEFYLKIAQLEPGDLPPVLDIEKTGDLSPQKLRHDVKAWLDIVEKAYGVKPIISANLISRMPSRASCVSRERRRRPVSMSTAARQPTTGAVIRLLSLPCLPSEMSRWKLSATIRWTRT